MKLFKFSEITYEKAREEVNYFLQQTYNKAGQLFSPASTYGQILSAIEQLYQLSILYLKNAISLFDMSDKNSNNYKIVRSNAVVAGHDPTRSISSTGTLRLRVKSDVDITEDIPSRKVVFYNKTKIKNSTNGLFYSLDLGSDSMTYNVELGKSYYINIIQGEWSTATFTGTGEINQSYQVNLDSEKEIENFNVEVKVNGQYWEVKKHLYDLIPNELGCVVKTSFDGGVDVVFGNGSYGEIPPIGSIIEVDYLVSDGNLGNIYRETTNDFTFVEDVLDGYGNTIEIANFFDIYINNDINFGAEGESVEFMRNILPLNSNNFVLALPQQYAYQIKKLGVFSYVNAYDGNGEIKIIAAPNVKLFKNQNSDYFTVNIDAFQLDEYEVKKLDNYLKIGGNIKLTNKYTISSPTLSYYIMYVYIRTFSDVEDGDINTEILDKVSDYFLNINRYDRIPKKDLINLISDINGVDSIDIKFVCKKNEDYHRQYKKVDTSTESIYKKTEEQLTKDGVLVSYQPNKVIGIDPKLGDIIFEPNEYPIIRGGWEDRYGIYYGETPLDKLSSINIIKQGVTERKSNIN